MRKFLSSRQWVKHPPGRFRGMCRGAAAVAVLAILAAVVAGMVVWLWIEDRRDAAGSPAAKGHDRRSERTKTEAGDGVTLPRPPESAQLAPAPEPALVPAATAPPSPRLGAPRAVAEILRDYGRAADAEAREEAARDLATMDTPEALSALGTLFARARAYPERVVLVGALADSREDAVQPLKVRLLREALAAGQPRPVRRAALDVLAQMEGPEVSALLLAATKDADAEIREVARGALGE